MLQEEGRKMWAWGTAKNIQGALQSSPTGDRGKDGRTQNKEAPFTFSFTLSWLLIIPRQEAKREGVRLETQH